MSRTKNFADFFRVHDVNYSSFEFRIEERSLTIPKVMTRYSFAVTQITLIKSHLKKCRYLNYKKYLKNVHKIVKSCKAFETTFFSNRNYQPLTERANISTKTEPFLLLEKNPNFSLKFTEALARKNIRFIQPRKLFIVQKNSSAFREFFFTIDVTSAERKKYLSMSCCSNELYEEF